jgi:hypothetical protein
MPAPYSGDPPPAVVQNHADGIFYGIKGVLTDTTCKDALKEIICDGISDGYDKILVNHPDGIKIDWNGLAEEVHEGIYDAVVQLIDDKKIVDRQGAIFLMAWLAQAADQRSAYLRESKPSSIIDLKEFIQEITLIIDAP